MMYPLGIAFLILFLLFVLLAPAIALLSQTNGLLLLATVQKANFTAILSATILSAVGGAAVSVVLGLFFARYFAFHSWRGQRIQRLVLLVPFLVPNFVLAAAYVVGWNPQTGLLNSVFRFPFGLYGIVGMTWLFAVAHVPVAFLTLEDKFRRIDSALREAAQMSGARPGRVFCSIELPLLLPSLIAAFVLSFVLNISAFAIPAWIGAPERAYTLAFKVYQSIQLGGPDGIPQAACYAMVLVAIVFAALGVLTLTDRNEARFKLISGKSSRKREDAMNFSSAFVFQTFFWASQLLSWMAPLGCLLISTFVPPGCLQSNGLLCLTTPSLRSYIYVLTELPETRLAFLGSFLYGGIAALCIVALCLALLMTFASSNRGLQMTGWITTLASAIPGSVIALGLIVVYSGRFHINLYNTAWIVVLAFIIKHMNLAYQPLRTGLVSLSTSLFEAGRMAGATRRQVWTGIVLPILRPEIIGGSLLVLVPILGELTMSVFLVSPQYRSIGTLLFDLQDYSDQGSAAALSVILVVSVLILNELARRLTGGRLGY